MPHRRLLIAIDGPAGVGKSATARELARRLGIPYLDTGAMYRAVALLTLRHGYSGELDALGRERVASLAAGCRIEFRGGPSGHRLLLDGDDVTEALREAEVTKMASVVSAIPAVRREMVRRQRELAAAGGGVIEGRDIGTVVFPDAAIKVFLTASPEVRARRRHEELRERGNVLSWQQVLGDQRARDQRDSSRADSPLKPAEDAFVLDTSALSLAEVVARVLALLERAP